MSDKSRIEWTDATWNPIRGTKGRHHCVRISEGCKHCYAAAMNHRFGGPDYVKGADTPRLDEEALLQPLRWKRPRRIFVCSMTDLFMDEHSDEMIDRVFAVMALAPEHTFQVLTKRAKRMRHYFATFDRNNLVGARIGKIYDAGHGEHPGWMFAGGQPWAPLHNVWLGVSAENQERADERIPELLATPAAVRFVSAEPLLGPIDLLDIAERHGSRVACCDRPGCERCDGTGESRAMGIHWVIVGGESGPGARSCDVSWTRSIKDQCAAAGVACGIPVTGFIRIFPVGSIVIEGRNGAELLDETRHRLTHGSEHHACRPLGFRCGCGA